MSEFRHLEAQPTPPGRRRGSIRLSDDEAWEVVRSAHTGIVTSLRRDGAPVALPVWFVVEDRVIWLSTLASSKKVTRLRNNPNASFLVESGERWAELRAVHLSCTARIVEGDKVAWVDAQKATKYAAYQTARAQLPARTRDHYGARRVAISLHSDPRILSWDNSRI